MNQKIISLVLVASLCSPVGSFADSSVVQAASKKDLVLKSVVEKVGEKYKRIADKMPKGLVATVDILRRQDTQEALQEKIAGLKDGTVSVAEMRQETLKQNFAVIKDQKAELNYQLSNLKAEELDEIATSMTGNPAYVNENAEYASAFKQAEKAAVLSRVVSGDLDRLMMVVTKRAGLMNVGGFVKDLEQNKAAHNSKSREDIEQALLIAGISIVGVGLVTWGVAAISYGGKLSNRRSDLESQLKARRSQMEANYNSLSTRLNQEENTYLQNNGYVYTTCSTYQRPDSFLCSNLNYQLVSGQASCTVKCMMNSQGKQTRHESPVCTSSFIPANCTDPNLYSEGQNDGYADGYYDGYGDGSWDGEDDGAYDGYYDGYDDGYIDGYDLGYTDGYSDGYNSYFGSSMAARSSTNTKAGYSPGYQQGLADSQSLLQLMDAGK